MKEVERGKKRREAVLPKRFTKDEMMCYFCGSDWFWLNQVETKLNNLLLQKEAVTKSDICFIIGWIHQHATHFINNKNTKEE